jgi:hypothetical protein
VAGGEVIMVRSNLRLLTERSALRLELTCSHAWRHIASVSNSTTNFHHLDMPIAPPPTPPPVGIGEVTWRLDCSDEEVL